MKIALAQIRTKKGNISENIKTHLKYIDKAIDQKSDLIIFPELSITGYEPDLANGLACSINDTRFDQFQNISDKNELIIGVGMPAISYNGVCISLLIFQPNLDRQIYSKAYLHDDEIPFFIGGDNETNFIKNTTISLAICYEIFVVDHADKAHKEGATIYLASVAKSQEGVEKAYKRLSRLAKNKQMVVLMCNNIGPCDNFESVGRSAAWDREGQLINQLEYDKEGLLIIDTNLLN